MNPLQSGPAGTAGFERDVCPAGPDATRESRIGRNGQDPGQPREPGGTSGGALGARPVTAQTFHGSDPDTVATSAICDVTPTKCQARTRLYRGLQVQRRSFELRKSLVLLRRIVIPMREVTNALMRRDLHVVTDDLMPYYQDIYDHVLRAAEWTDSLRDLVTSILETNLTIQGNRMNVITKKVTSWAAIIAVPTFITGFYGMNVPYPGFSRQVGFAASIALMIIAGLVLYIIFKRKDWL